MCDIIFKSKKERDIISTQLNMWWKKNTSHETIAMIDYIYRKYMANNQTLAHTIERLKEMFLQASKDKKTLASLIDEYLIPQDLERKENAEIPTPHALRKQMLDAVPSDFWSDVTYSTKPCYPTVFEPCCGKGGFLLDVVDRLMEGLKNKIQDEEERYRVVVEECLYWADVNPVNVFICKLLLDPEEKYKLLCWEGDTLSLNIESVWGVDGFGLVVGNPPYSSDPSKQDTMPIYNLFVDKFIDVCEYMVFVIPSRWFSGGKGLDRFRGRMKSRGDIALIKHIDNAREWFRNVSIEGGVCYFLKKKGYDGKCSFNGVEIDLGDYDIVVKPRDKALVDWFDGFEKIDKLYMNSSFYKVRTNDKRLVDKGDIPVFVSMLKSKDRKKYLKKYDLDKEMTWKVITARANGKNPHFGYMCISSPDELYTDSYIAFKAQNKDEAESILSYLKCKLPNRILAIRKISQDISTKVIKWIPIVPFDRIWNDEQVNQYFGINKEILE